MKVFQTWLASLLVLLTTAVFAQLTPINNLGKIEDAQLAKRLNRLEVGRQFRDEKAICQYDEIKAELYANPAIKQQAELQEKQLQKAIRKMELQQAQGTYKADVYTIPVVFHVLHIGEAVGVGNNIPTDQIESAIEALNRDYRRTAADGGIAQGNGVDAEIEFCLASIDPNGDPHSGINRINANGVTNYQNVGIEESVNGETLKNLSKWPTEDYVNVWVVREIKDQGDVNSWSGGTLGYAYPVSSGSNQNPNTNPAFNEEDGIVVVNFSLGNDPNNTHTDWDLIFTRNRTLTHEMGHHLNLQHTFEGDACNESDCATEGDFVCDTPPTTQQTKCNTPACSGTQQVENYMDYTGETCADMFSQGQVNRMRAVLEGFSRSSLTVSAGCSPDVVTAEFSASPLVVVVGQDVQFTDLSESGTAVNDWDWDFGDGNSSTLENPIHSYGSVGLKSVTLTASNGINDDVITKTDYINVVPGANGVCDTLTNLVGDEKANLTGYNYPAGGYIPGHAKDIAGYAEQFVVQSGYQLTSFQVGVFIADFGNANSTVQFIVYGDNNGSPGSELKILEYKISDVEAGFFNVIELDQPLDVDGTFYIGMEYPDAVAGDTVLIACSQNRASGQNSAFVKTNTGVWASFTDGFSISVAMAIEPNLGKPATANIASFSPEVCKGEKVDFDASGSTNAGLYSWTFQNGTPSTSTSVKPSPKFNTSGTKTITLTVDNGCGLKDDVSKSITVNPAPTLQVSSDPADCGDANGSATVVATGGSTFDYSWSNGGTTATIADVAAGSYFVIVENEFNCMTEKPVTVEEIMPDFTVETEPATCEEANGSATVVHTVSGAYTYEWIGTTSSASSISNVPGGSYSILVGLATCEELRDVTVDNVGEVPTVDIRVQSGEVNFTTSGNSGDTYLWNFGDGGSATDQNPTHTYTAIGTYPVTVVVTNSNGCSATSDILSIEIDRTTGIQHVYGGGANLVTVIPNPNRGNFVVELSNEAQSNTTIRLLSPIGKVILDKTVTANQTAINVVGIAAGVYYLQVSNGDKVTTTKVEIT